jgi:hypothetical protein
VIKREILAAIGALPDVLVFVNAQTFTRFADADGRLDRASRGGLGAGSADLIGIVRVVRDIARPDLDLGRFIALEVKAPRGVVSDVQKRWLEAVRRMGGFAAVVRSVEEARGAIDRARKGDAA